MTVRKFKGVTVNFSDGLLINHFKKDMTAWKQALAEFQVHKGQFVIPKKGSKDYDKVKKIQARIEKKNKKKAKADKKAAAALEKTPPPKKTVAKKVLAPRKKPRISKTSPPPSVDDSEHDASLSMEASSAEEDEHDEQ